MPTNSKLPDLIYQGKDIPDVARLYETELRKNDDFQSNIHATAYSHFRTVISDKNFLKVLRKEFDSLYIFLDKENPHLRFNIEGRRKSLISFENKIIRLLSENRSVDSLRDIFAFRIIIFGDFAEEELIRQCYCIMNQLIMFYVAKGYTLCEEDPVSNTLDKDCPECEEIAKDIIIPKETGINKEYLYSIKDYILRPKKNGYQSLHCAFRTTAGFCFEVQVRTLQMDIIATEGEADHDSYKKSKYLNQVKIDPLKVNIPGYCVSKKGTVIDRVGLEKPLSIFSYQKTF